MVNTWKERHIKIDGISHKVNVELIAQVIEIPMEGKYFYRNKKMLAKIVKESVKDEEKRKKLVKAETYYIMESTKKLQRYVLRVFFQYISLDTRFDKVKTHHFFLLNHFRHVLKISFPFYLFTSMRKGIEGFKKKPIVDLALHEGFLLLVYKYPSAQRRVKYLGHSRDASKDTRSSKYSNSKEVHSLSSEDEDNTLLKGKKTKGGEKFFPSTNIIPSRNTPLGLTPDPPKPKE